MCGIVGFAKRNCLTDIYDGLKQLEYRGYDSAGLAYFYNKKIRVIKKQGRVSSLLPLLPDVKSDVGIGHTRWATHGVPSDVNAHPHRSKRFVIVHNGIIENYLELKDLLVKNGFSFESETDTEVIAKLLEYLYRGDVLKTIFQLKKYLKGSYALAILFADEPDRIYLTKQENPLIIGKGKGFNCFASDTPAIVKHTSLIYKMKDGESAIITAKDIRIFKDETEIFPAFVKTRLSYSQLDKGKFSSYMQKEINDLPQAIANTLNCVYANGLKDKTLNAIRECERIYLVGCGSAYHACLYAKTLLEEKGFDVFCETSGEFRYKKNMPPEKTLVVAVTQSGETSDTIGAVKRAKKSGRYVIAITNVPDSNVTVHATDTIVTQAGAEIAVAATKSYNAQLVALRYLIERICEEKGKNIKSVNVDQLSRAVKTTIKISEKIKKIEKQYDNLFFIGRSFDYATALEGALKVKEIAYIPSDACPAAEIKHGPLAMVGDKTLVVCIITVKKLIGKSLNAINEVISRGADVLAITAYDLGLDNQILLPKLPEDLLPVLSVIPLQTLALSLTERKGLDPDKPRHLAKSVTVE